MVKETKMKVGDKIKFKEGHMSFMFGLDSIPAKVFTIEDIDEEGGIILEEDTEPKTRMAFEWLEPASK